MRILDRYICREVFSHALLGLSIFTFVFFVPQLVRLMDVIVRHSSGAGVIALLIGCAFPAIFTFTIPIAALVGVLIGLGRLSADGEIVGLNASGIGLRRLLVPITVLAAVMGMATLADTLWLSPLALRTLHSLETRLMASQVSLAIQPRVFDERFPHFVLYVNDVDSTASRWSGVLLAQTDQTPISRLTLAEKAIVLADPAEDKLEIHLGQGSTHEYNSADPHHYGYTTFGASDLPIEVTAQVNLADRRLTDAEQRLGVLYSDSSPGWRLARVEFHRRLAFPAACLVFALLAVPVGVRPRRGGRAGGFILTLVLVAGYYAVFVFGIRMAQAGILSPGLGVWLANIIGLILAVAMIVRIERLRGAGRLATYLLDLQRNVERWLRIRRRARRRARAALGRPGLAVVPANGGESESELRAEAGRAAGFPLLIDLHILGTFLSYFLLLLAGFLALFDSFTVFDLLSDIARNHASASLVLNYLRYLVPLMVYQLTPLAVLVATLITLAILAKNNELVACKASGISLYRITLPLLVAGLLISGSLFLLDDTYLPYANQKQDALRNEIKGRPAQTFYSPTHRWIFGAADRIYNYDFFDSDRDLFAGLNIFELDPATFQMRRRIYGAQAHWEPALGAWVVENGWVRDFSGGRVSQYKTFRVATFGELAEQPSYFKREVLPSSQMNWRQLGGYIAGLRQAGFDTARLSVEWQRKFAYPLIALIIVFLSAPFALLVGTRGALGGLAAAVGISIVYWAIAALFEAMGSVGQLPPLLAGWAPDAIFAFLGAYFFLRMPT
jgi:LPS export ABC transporter permease LptG/LPS export ABC transporter permease LptF